MVYNYMREKLIDINYINGEPKVDSNYYEDKKKECIH